MKLLDVAGTQKTLRLANSFKGVRHAVSRVAPVDAHTELKVLWPLVVAILVLLAVCKAGAGAAIYPVLALWALQGRRQAIEALALAFLATYLNPAFFPSADMSGTLRWLPFTCASLRIFYDSWRYKTPLPRSIWYLWLFSGFAVLSTVVNSQMPVLSLGKIITFTMGVSAALLGARLSSRESGYWKSWFFTFFLVVLCLSIPTLLVSSIGRANNGLGFQGILNQPQAFGIFLCPIVAWLTAAYLLRQHHSNRVALALVLGWAGVFLSLARTSLVAIVVGGILSMLAMALVKPNALRHAMSSIMRRQSTVLKLLGLVCILFVIVTLKWSSVDQAAQDFVNKRGGETTTIVGEFQKSRGELVEDSMTNFYKAPLFGIGFGVPSNSQNSGLSSSTVGIIMSAPAEKGFLPSATLEENGIIGTAFLLLFIFSLIREVAAKGDFSSLWLLGTCIGVNVGEMIFFATGGIGMFFWLLMGLAAIPSPQEQTLSKKSKRR